MPSVVAIAIVFFWIRQELAGAWSADTASFALIIYYAVAGLVLIFAGRTRGVGPLRAVGLGLVFLAGFDAILETSQIGSVALRVGARIVVGIFLAAVGYWYRTPSEPAAVTESDDEPHFQHGAQKEITIQ
jgi:hypothetical protein